MPTGNINACACTISNTPGGANGFVVAAAVPGPYRMPRSLDNGKTVLLFVYENAAWEVCESVYTHGTTTFSRGAMRDSSTGARIGFTSAAQVTVVGTDALRVDELIRAAEASLQLQQRDIYFWSTAGGNGSAMIQQAANDAMAQGKNLVLGPGELDFSSSGGPVMGTGLDTVRNGVVGNAYKALAISGAGIGLTKVLVGPGQRAFFWANDTTAIGLEGGVEKLSIIGTGIGSNSVAIQMGGRSAVRSDLMENMHTREVFIDNVTSCVILDDVTGWKFPELRLGRFKYGIEFGHNIDTIEGCVLGGPDESLLMFRSVSVTNGSNVVTVPAQVGARLQVGYSINCKGYFPYGAYVGSINAEGTAISIVNYNGVPINCAGPSGSALAHFVVGRLLNYGTRVPATPGLLYASKGSPFVSPYWSTQNAPTAGRISGNNHKIGGTINGIELLIDCGGGSHFGVNFDAYGERNNAIAIFGDPGSDQQAYGFNFSKNYFGFQEFFLQPPITVECNTPNYKISIKGGFCDSVPSNFPWFYVPTVNYGTGRLVWEDNNLQTAASAATQGNVHIGRPLGSPYACMPNIPTGGAFYQGSARQGDAIQDWVDGSWDYHHQDGLRVNLAGASKSINNPATYTTSGIGKRFNVYATAAAGNTLTFGTMFRGVNGAPLGTVAAGTTGQLMVLPFIWDGAFFRLQLAPAWSSPT